MKQYTIITTHYEGSSGRYETIPKKVSYIQNYFQNEREDFINRWEYILKQDIYFDPPKCYFTDYQKMIIIDITDKLTELKERI